MILITEKPDIFKSLYENNIQNFAFQSIIAGNTPGNLYVDSMESPNLYFFFDIGNFTLHLGGESPDIEDYMQCITYIKNSILTDSLKKKYYDSVKISFTSDKWKEAALTVFKSFSIKERKRVLYKFDGNKEPISQKNCGRPITFHTSLISKELLYNTELENSNSMCEEVAGMWGSVENFIQKGFGTCAMVDNKLISWCTAELLSDGSVGIGIETIPSAQKKGAGAVLAYEFLYECIKRDLTPYWDSWESNYGSVKIAEKVGFSKYKDYSVLFLEY